MRGTQRVILVVAVILAGMTWANSDVIQVPSEKTLDEAVKAVQDGTAGTDTIWLAQGTYTYNLSLGNAAKTIKIIGQGTEVGDVVIKSTSPTVPVLELDGASASVMLEGITLTGGSNGVSLNGGAGPVILNRCVIQNNFGHGVQSSGTTANAIVLVNCAIIDNFNDGVHVTTSGAAGGGSSMYLLHCNVLRNRGNGVYVSSSSAARVVNSLVYANQGIRRGQTLFEYLVGARQDSPSGLVAMAGSEWTFGAPLGYPATAAFTGNSIFGVNLANLFTANPDGAIQYLLTDHKGPNDVIPTFTLVPATLPTVVGGWAISRGLVPVPTGDGVMIGDVNIVLDMTHPCPRGIRAILEHQGVSVELINGLAGVFCLPNMNETVIDDEAELALTDTAAALVPNFAGAFKPYAPLSAFDGLPMEGDWRLRVFDSGGAFKYEFLTAYASAGFTLASGSEWQFGAPQGLGGDQGNRDPLGDSTGEAGGEVCAVNLNGDYRVNPDGVYTNDTHDTEYAYSGTTIKTKPGDWVYIPLTISTAGAPVTIGDLNLELDIAHPCASSLKAKLVHNGIEAVLFDSVNGCDPNFQNTLFDDEAPNTVVDGAAPFNGVYAPQAPLNAFDGMTMEGTWELKVYDKGEYAQVVSYMTEDSPGAGGLLKDAFLGSEWAFGQPRGNGATASRGYPDPVAGATGAEAFGVNLDGDYRPSIDGDAQFAGDDPYDYEYTSTATVTTVEGATKVSSLFVPVISDPTGEMVVGDVNVKFNITHPLPSNLRLALKHNGVTVPLLDKLPAIAANFQQTVIDDEAANPIANAAAPFTGAFRSVLGSLSMFDGMTASGSWELSVYDAVGGGIFLDDSFNQGAAPKWSGFGSEWLLDANTGSYYNAIPTGSVSRYTDSQAETWTDYTYTTEFRIPSWTTANVGGNMVGIAFRCTSPQNYYSFYIKDVDNTGLWIGVAKVQGGTPTNLYGPIKITVPNIIDLNIPLTVKATAQVVGTQIAISGQVSTPYTSAVPITIPVINDGTFLNGSIGLIAYNLTAYFDSVAVQGTGSATGALNSWTLQIEPMHYMATPAIDFTNFEKVKLAYQRWLNTGGDAIATVECYDPVAATWTRLFGNSGSEITNNAWVPEEYDISALAAGKDGVRVRWGYHAGLAPLSGWNVDDVEFLAPMLGTVNAWNLEVEPVYYLTTPALDFPENDKVELTFERWLNAGSDALALIECYDPSSGKWERIFDNAGAEVADNAWVNQGFDITDYAAQRNGVYVRWGYHAGRLPYAGWNIDDIRFGSGATGTLDSWGIQVEPIYYLTTAPMDFSSLASTDTLELHFQRWLATGPDSLATIDYSTSAGTWTPLWSNRDGAGLTPILDASWIEQVFNLASVGIGQDKFRVRWGYHAGQIPAPGWSLDDIIFAHGAPLGGGLVAENTSVGSGSNNCAFGNGGMDRINFADESGAKDVDPLLLSGYAYGKLDAASPIRDMGAPVTYESYTDKDIENDMRIVNPAFNVAPDIGADEVFASGSIAWTRCVVTGPGGLTGLIGAVQPNALSVEIDLTGGLTPNAVFVTPQGVNHNAYLTNPEYIIPLVQSGTRWTNQKAITTLLFDVDNSGDTTIGDVIADGHATVWVVLNGTFLEPSGQAVSGRHFLIDTIAPVLDVQLTPPNSTFDASHFFTALNDTNTANSAIGLFNGSSFHMDYPSITLPLGERAAPLDEGSIMPVAPGYPANGSGATILFNTGYIPNGVNPENLNLQVTAIFVDPPVTAPDGTIITSPPDELTGETERKVASFTVDDPATTPIEVIRIVDAPAAELLFDDIWPAGWNPSTVDGVPNIDVHAIYTLNEAELRVVWSFFDSASGDTGIPWGMLVDSEYRLSAQFIGRDKAGNVTQILQDPVHAIWMLTPLINLSPKQLGTFSINDAAFSWSLDRTTIPEVVNSPKPLFSYRLWAAQENGSTTFNAVTGWTSWAINTSNAFDYFTDVENQIAGRDVIFAVSGVDEAGNVTSWPNAELECTSSGKLTLKTSNTFGVNWVLFRAGEREKPSESIKTALMPAFWYESMNPLDAAYDAAKDGAALGAATTLPLPAANSGMSLLGKMTLSVVKPALSQGSIVKSLSVDWELEARGWRWTGTFTRQENHPALFDLLLTNQPGQTFNYIDLPNRGYLAFPDGWSPNLDSVDLNKLTLYFKFPDALTEKMPCVFRARSTLTYWGIDEHNQQVEYTIADASPARFAFVVTPSYGTGLRPRDSSDHQPIVVQMHEE